MYVFRRPYDYQVRTSLRVVLYPFGVSITGSATVIANLRVTAPLATDITGTALVTAALSETTLLAVTINSSALIGATLTESTKLATDITGSALLVGQLLLPPLRVNINATGTVVPNLATPQPLEPWGSITGTATVTALFDKNIEHTTSTITFTQSATHLNEYVGNALALTQQVTSESTLSPEPENTLTLVQTLGLEGTFSPLATTVWGTLDHTASFAHTLPTETASSILTFSDSAEFARAAENTLNLTQVAAGVIGGIEESANNTLSLVSTVALDLVSNLSVTSQLILTQTVVNNYITSWPASNDLDFNQSVFNIPINSVFKAGRWVPLQYVLLQAPFNNLQTSIVLPAPLWGDTENITNEVSLRRSMNGATKTYVKTNKNRRLTYTFRLLEEVKAIELLEFCRFYNSDEVKLTNWKGEVWKVNFLTNPYDFVQTRRSGIDIALELEGEKLYG